MENNFTYHLEKYTGKASRHECPQCGDPHSFVYYVDRDGHPLDKTCGRCNHESGCGFHYTPAMYFRDHPEAREQRRKAWSAFPATQWVPMRPVRIPPDYVPVKYVANTLSYFGVFDFLGGVLPGQDIRRVCDDYFIGMTDDGATIFWQIDGEGHVRTGKIIQYNPETGHRTGNPDWAHAVLKRRGVLPATFRLEQCLFGEHLLAKRPNVPVALVEAEKTAIVGAAVFPSLVWVATGGKSQWGKMRPLRGRKVLAFPDVDAYEEWGERAAELNSNGYNIKVANVLQEWSTDEERARKIDIADWILEQLEATPRPSFDHGEEQEGHGGKKPVEATPRPSFDPSEEQENQGQEIATEATPRPSFDPIIEFDPLNDRGQIIIGVPIVDAHLRPTGNVVDINEEEVKGLDLRRLCAEHDVGKGSYRIHVLPAPVMATPKITLVVPYRHDHSEDAPFF